MNKTKKNSLNLEAVGILLFIISLLTVVIFFLAGKSNTKDSTQIVNTTATQESDLASKENWAIYKSNIWGFSIEYPRYLFVQLVDTNKRYLNFVVFQKTKYTNYSGAAVGVSDLSLNDEAEKIIEEIKNSDSTNPSKESNVYLNNIKAIRLDYKAANKDQEDKAVIVVNDGMFTYSVSTTTNQINDFIRHFQLLGSYGFCTDPDINTLSNRYISSYCSGYYCNSKKTKPDCEAVDVVSIVNDIPLDKEAKDGISDCKWVLENNNGSCKPFF